MERGGWREVDGGEYVVDRVWKKAPMHVCEACAGGHPLLRRWQQGATADGRGDCASRWHAAPPRRRCGGTAADAPSRKLHSEASGMRRHRVSAGGAAWLAMQRRGARRRLHGRVQLIRRDALGRCRAGRTNKQTSKQTNNQTNKQTNKQTNRTTGSTAQGMVQECTRYIACCIHT